MPGSRAAQLTHRTNSEGFLEEVLSSKKGRTGGLINNTNLFSPDFVPGGILSVLCKPIYLTYTSNCKVIISSLDEETEEGRG